jgi:hypothetical protein
MIKDEKVEQLDSDPPPPKFFLYCEFNFDGVQRVDDMGKKYIW